MRIITDKSSYYNVENVGDEIVLRKEEGTTFISESKEDADKLKVIVEKFLGITNKEDD